MDNKLDNKKILDYLHDKDFRQGLKSEPKLYAIKLGYEVSDDTTIKILENSKDLIYITMSDNSFNYHDLEMTNAAMLGVSTAGTASSVGSFSSVCSSASSLSCAGTIGSSGSVHNN